MESVYHGKEEPLIIRNRIICKKCKYDLQGFFADKFLETKQFLDTSISNSNHISKEEVLNRNQTSSDILLEEKYSLINTKDIFNKITKKVVGQDEAVKNILARIIKNLCATTSYTKSNIFIIGGTGNGKTETVKQIAKELKIPYVIEDASKYTQEGYVGESVENAIHKLLAETNNNIRLAERGIIVFDEMDKKINDNFSSGIATTNVQDSMLKMLEGTIVHTKFGKLNTEKITFIFICSCEKAYKARKDRLNGKGKIGFYTSDNKNKELKNEKFIPDDLVEAGFKRELVGRMPTIQEFKILDKNDFVNIINNSEISLLNLTIRDIEKMGYRIVMKKDVIVDAIATRAVELNVGVRAIDNIIDEMFSGFYSDIMFNDEKVKNRKACNFFSDIVYDNTKYEFM